MLSNIVPDDSIQGNLFSPSSHNEYRYLMDVIDNVNFSMRDDMLKFASSGTARDWKMRQELRSKRHTTRWEELYEVEIISAIRTLLIWVPAGIIGRLYELWLWNSERRLRPPFFRQNGPPSPAP